MSTTQPTESKYYLLDGATYFGQNPGIVQALKGLARNATSSTKIDRAEIKIGTVFTKYDLEELIKLVPREEREKLAEIVEKNPAQGYKEIILRFIELNGLTAAYVSWDAKVRNFSTDDGDFTVEPSALSIKKSGMSKTEVDKLAESDFQKDRRGQPKNKVVVNLAGIVRDGFTNEEIKRLREKFDVAQKNFAYAVLGSEGVRRTGKDDFDKDTHKMLQTSGDRVAYSAVTIPLYIKEEEYSQLMEKLGLDGILGVRSSFIERAGNVRIFGQVYFEKTIKPKPTAPTELETASEFTAEEILELRKCATEKITKKFIEGLERAAAYIKNPSILRRAEIAPKTTTRIGPPIAEEQLGDPVTGHKYGRLDPKITSKFTKP